MKGVIFSISRSNNNKFFADLQREQFHDLGQVRLLNGGKNDAKKSGQSAKITKCCFDFDENVLC